MTRAALTFGAITLSLWVLSMPLWATVGEQRATTLLRKHGYSVERLGGYAMLACGDDLFVREFTARARGGERVEGYVCCGVLKACTLRWKE